MMDRRAFLDALALLAAPRAAEAQQQTGGIVIERRFRKWQAGPAAGSGKQLVRQSDA